MDIPVLNPVDFKSDADFVMKTDGHVFAGATCLTCSAPSSVGDWKTGGGSDLWMYDASKQLWTSKTDSMPPGTYYSEGAIDFPNDPGNGGPAISMTLIAEGYVLIGGNPWFQADLVKNGTAYAIISGHDLKLNGNKQVDGVNYCRHQLSISGDPVINGQVIALDEADPDYPNSGDENPVVRLSGGFMEISGNPTIAFDGGTAMANLTQSSWRECRGSNPATPCL